MHLGGHEGGIDGVAGGLALQDRQHLLGGLYGDLALRLPSGRAQVRRNDDLGVLQ